MSADHGRRIVDGWLVEVATWPDTGLIPVVHLDDIPGYTTERARWQAEAVAEYQAGQQQGIQATCGGCQGLGAHSPRCPTQPGHRWRRLADQAKSLGDQIGPKDPEAANHAYWIADRMRQRETLAREHAQEDGE